MMEPRRLIDDSPGELEAALLRAGRETRASSRARLSTLAALGVAGSAVVAGKSAAATLSSSSVQQLVAAGAVAVAATIGVLALTVGRSTPPIPAASVPVAVTSPTASPPSGSDDVVEAPAATPESTAPAAAAPAVSPPRTASTPAPVAPRPAPSASLADETRSLDAARKALAAGDSSGALTRLDDHARRFPRGGLALEAEVLRIEALAQSGNRAAAATRARAFVARHPSSVFTPRVRRIAGE